MVNQGCQILPFHYAHKLASYRLMSPYKHRNNNDQTIHEECIFNYHLHSTTIKLEPAARRSKRETLMWARVAQIPE